MYRHFLQAKIHTPVVTDSRLDYEGSLTIDWDLLDAAGIRPTERVLVANLSNGSRHETYAIPGKRGSGTICSNGAAAHLVQPGDRIIVMTFAWLSEAEWRRHAATVVLVDDRNRIVRIKKVFA